MKTAFAYAFVLAIAGISASSLRSQPVDQQSKPYQKRRTQVELERSELERIEPPPFSMSDDAASLLLRQYLELAELKAKTMSVSELRQAVQEMQWLKAEAKLVPIMHQLHSIAEQNPETVTAHKARMAIQLLQTRNGRILNEVQEALSRERLSTETPAATVPDRTVTEELQDARGGAERRRRAYEEEARRALDRYNTWQGTSTALSQGALIKSREGYETVLRVFNADPPAPQGRLREFSGYVEENAEYKVVAWRVGIESVTPDGRGGWKATVRVGATLAALRGGIPFTPYETLETWQIGKDGTAKALDVRAGDKPHFLIVD